MLFPYYMAPLIKVEEWVCILEVYVDYYPNVYLLFGLNSTLFLRRICSTLLMALLTANRLFFVRCKFDFEEINIAPTIRSNIEKITFVKTEWQGIDIKKEYLQRIENLIKAISKSVIIQSLKELVFNY